MHYFAHIAVVNGSSPAKDVEDTIDVSAVVPPNALSLSVDGAFNAVNSSAGSTIQYALRIVSGNDIVTFSSIVSVAATYGNVGIIKIVPNRLQTLYYAWTSFGGVTSAPYSILFVNSYKVPNGGE